MLNISDQEWVLSTQLKCMIKKKKKKSCLGIIWIKNQSNIFGLENLVKEIRETNESVSTVQVKTNQTICPLTNKQYNI